MLDLKVPPRFQYQLNIAGSSDPISPCEANLTPGSPEIFKNLNNSQRHSVGRIRELHVSRPGLYFIHGGSGTGKTMTIVKLIMSLIADKRPVWVAAPSNNAVEVILEKLSNEPNIDRNKLLRISAQNRDPPPSIQEFLLPKRIEEKKDRDAIENEKQRKNAIGHNLSRVPQSVDEFFGQALNPDAETVESVSAITADEKKKSST
ncbi:hypothetical protein GEMRC1_006632 [Eukaryota sp. GEM-RC1]